MGKIGIDDVKPDGHAIFAYMEQPSGNTRYQEWLQGERKDLIETVEDLDAFWDWHSKEERLAIVAKEGPEYGYHIDFSYDIKEPMWTLFVEEFNAHRLAQEHAGRL